MNLEYLSIGNVTKGEYIHFRVQKHVSTSTYRNQKYQFFSNVFLFRLLLIVLCIILFNGNLYCYGLSMLHIENDNVSEQYILATSKEDSKLLGRRHLSLISNSNTQLKSEQLYKLVHRTVYPLSSETSLWRSPFKSVRQWWLEFSFKGNRVATLHNSTKLTHASDESPYHNMINNAQWFLNDVEKYNLFNASGRLFAFGDFEGTKHTDLFFITTLDGKLALSIHKWDSKNEVFRTPIYFLLPKIVQEVESIIPLDINLDGTVDIVITFKENTSSWKNSQQYDILIMIQLPLSHELIPYWDTITNSTKETELFKTIVHPFVADINFDGYPDLIGQLNHDNTLSSINGRFVWINEKGTTFTPYIMDSPIVQSYFIDSTKSSISPNFLSQPHSSAFIDLDGDCIADLIFDVTTPTNERYLEVWLATIITDYSVDSNIRSLFDTITNEIKEEDVSSIDKIESLQDQNISFFKKIPQNNGPFYVYRYSPKHYLQLPKGAQQITYSDINGDGTTDIVFGVCSDDLKDDMCTGQTADTIHVIANVQAPLCRHLNVLTSTGIDMTCRNPAALCHALPFTWDLSISSLYPNNDIINPSDIIKLSGTSVFPITLRVGDFDLDGYPDIATVVHSTTEGFGILLMQNMIRLNNSTLPVFSPFQFLPAGKGVQLELAAFFDVSENGLLDILAVGRTSEKKWWATPSSHVSLLSYIQKVWDDPLFIKLNGLNGIVCDQDTPQKECVLPGYGSSCYGCTFKISGSDLSGIRFSRASSSLPQSAYSPFHTPYTILGLGFVNNYIDFFFFGAPLVQHQQQDQSQTSPNQMIRRRQLDSDKMIPEGLRYLMTESIIHNNVISNHTLKIDSMNNHMIGNYHRWISLIPNSFVIVNPIPRSNPDRWKLELSVSPSKKFWHILCATVLNLIAIGIAICVLDRKEKKEDLKEHQGFKHHFITTV